MSILLCDSNCELWYTRLKELNIDYIPMPYCYNGEEFGYDLGENTDFAKFYAAVRGGAVPKTMALNPENYIDIFTPYFENGEDVLYISFSHAMSGTFNQLDKALEQLKEKFPERKCTIFNTNSISLGAGIQVETAAEMKNNGATDEEIIAFLKDFTNRVAVYFVVDNLMHLKRGGRLSGTAAVAGTLLGLKPMITLDKDGGLSVYSKIVGKRRVLKSLADKVINELTGTEYSVYIVDADCKEEGDELAERIREKRPEAKLVRQTVGPVIGSHCGPGTLGVIFIADKRPIALEVKK